MSPDVLPLALDVGSTIGTPVVTGAINGAVYGLLGLGLVLLYKGNRIFNFAQGEFGTVAAFVCYAAVTGFGVFPELAYPIAAVLGVTAAVLTALLTERVVIRPLFRQPKVTLVVASAGVALLLIAVQGFVFGAEPVALPPVFEGAAYTSGSLRITKQAIVVVLALIVLAGASAAFFRYSRTGTAILAVSMEPTATSLVGISVNKISALTWGMAGLLAGVGGILFVGGAGALLPGALTGLALIPAFTAAVFGGITSLPGAFVGGIVIGIIQALAQRNIPESALPAASQVAVFGILLLVLLVRPAGLLGKEV